MRDGCLLTFAEAKHLATRVQSYEGDAQDGQVGLDVRTLVG